jgi:hypothetical protein
MVSMAAFLFTQNDRGRYAMKFKRAYHVRVECVSMCKNHVKFNINNSIKSGLYHNICY